MPRFIFEDSMTMYFISIGICFLLWLAFKVFSRPKNAPPAVPGLPIIGNLLQLKDKKPHMTFAKWAEQYGPAYTIKAGASTVLVLNSVHLAKEAMVTKYSSISTRKLPYALRILTNDKTMVAMSDYGEEHMLFKKRLLSSILGANALEICMAMKSSAKVQMTQMPFMEEMNGTEATISVVYLLLGVTLQKRKSTRKRLRPNRDMMIENVVKDLYYEAKANQTGEVNLRAIFKNHLFTVALKQSLGEDINSVYVKELGVELSRWEIFRVLVDDPMMGAIEVDWRDLFPYLKWLPNRRLESKIKEMERCRTAVVRALIEKQKKKMAPGEELDCYLAVLLNDGSLSETQMTMLVWETIVETSDTTMVTTEWAMYELVKNPNCQEHLYEEIKQVCGDATIQEEHLSQLPYLNAVFHETLRKHSPVPIVPLRYIHEDIQIGGYDIPSGTQVAVNIYACNHDTNEWEDPDDWKPERFLNEKYETLDLYKTMAFGGGRRVCSGSLLAMLTACTAIGRLVQEFEWRLCEGEEEKVDTVVLTTHKLHPMRATVTPRNGKNL